MVQERENFTPAEKKKMTLSKDTLDGLRMTGAKCTFTVMLTRVVLCMRMFQ